MKSFVRFFSERPSNGLQSNAHINNNMKKPIIAILAASLSLASFAHAKDVVDIAIGSKAHTTLVAAVKAADLVSTLKSDGPFTVFAPTNAAFEALPAGTVETLLKPENKAKLAGILTYHVVSGNLDAAAFISAIKSGKGKAVVTTVNGDALTASLENGKVKLTDSSGNSAYVVAADLKGDNGVVHVIDSVVLPK